ncbi:unnamed protein product [Urochloa decumbens]|uniref:Phytocyanin domain-containing protein n=1 Tax=Urochloa decumbens TaxID=240449 RepID=A0ABC9FWA0_9POAL
MAGRLRSAVLLASACAAVLLLAASASPSRPPAVYVVGDEMGWAVPPAGATDALNKWAAGHRFLVGDILLFRYTSGDDGPALLVTRDGYERCSAASPYAGGGGGGFASFTLGRPGTHHFISGTPWRCEAGQRMAVFVEDARSSRSSSGAAPTPAPGTTTQAPDTPLSPSGHRRLSLAQKQFAAAAIGFGAGFAFIFLIVSLCVCLKR